MDTISLTAGSRKLFLNWSGYIVLYPVNFPEVVDEKDKPLKYSREVLLPPGFLIWVLLHFIYS